jgi:Protein of unknown function (DUF3048) C-terminal domain/Protein of unknown function (DUF3048) N-terminal domain
VTVALTACTGESPEPRRTGAPDAVVSAPATPRPRPSATPGGAPRRGLLALTVGADGPPGSLVGIERAGTIVEYPVAADRTGLLVLLGTDADVVGPLRSATPSDAGLALAFGADLVTAVTTGAVVEQFGRAGLSVTEELTSPGAMVRDPDRRAPFNLYAVPSRVRAAVGERPAGTGWPPSGTAGPSGRGRTSAEVTVAAADGVAVTWTWDPAARRWLRTVADRLEQSATGERIGAGTVVVLEVPQAGRPVVAADLVGQGPALVLRGGALIPGRWTRADAADAPAIAGLGAVPPDATVWLHICAAPCASPSAPGAPS